jgi:pimeloyl-ACP methyl ester carboxylesterase
MTSLRKISGCLLATSLAGALAACSTVKTADQLTSACPSLTGRQISRAQIGLPSGDASLVSAVLVANTAGIPAHCKINGRIAPIDPAAKPIEFQINLPLQWNSKALQYGGGGFNGTLVTGLTPLRDAAPTDPLPIARGYATYGTDSGHKVSDYARSEPGAFALNDEMLENFAYASYKKVRDVAQVTMNAFYGRSASAVYYFGGSEGGREGLAMAQKFPADYQGVVSVVPVINWTGLFHAFVANQTPQFGDWLDASKVPLIAKATSDACDALDGLVDGVVNNYQACQSRVKLEALRCPNGNDAGAHCLSDAELGVMRLLHAPYRFPFRLANGISSYPGWYFGHEDSLDGPSAMSYVRWVSGSAAPTVPANASTASTHWLYGNNWIRYAIARDANYDVRQYKPEAFAARVQATSAMMDFTNPDLSAFFSRGGKLIIRENAADRAQSPAMGFEYYKSMVALMGQATVDKSARLYVSPASTHSGNARSVLDKTAVPTMADLLDILDKWVSADTPPPEAVMQTRHAAQAPFAIQATRPMCRYPAYPHYTGGDPLLARSFACRQ